eukprot:297693-Pyramimonas_sp.AAC.1
MLPLTLGAAADEVGSKYFHKHSSVHKPLSTEICTDHCAWRVPNVRARGRRPEAAWEAPGGWG